MQGGGYRRPASVGSADDVHGACDGLILGYQTVKVRSAWECQSGGCEAEGMSASREKTVMERFNELSVHIEYTEYDVTILRKEEWDRRRLLLRNRHRVRVVLLQVWTHGLDFG
jgi:hypothetical protein